MQDLLFIAIANQKAPFLLSKVIPTQNNNKNNYTNNNNNNNYNNSNSNNKLKIYREMQRFTEIFKLYPILMYNKFQILMI